ncbi:MAG TPA: hypothetical protein VH110_03670 [Candidatus Acidoferrum sp.]|nr:hypothetical protein [Candidatus Acidoferrum sp.]
MVFQVALEGGGHTVSLLGSEWQSRHHKRKVPSEFGLVGSGEQAQQLGFVGLQQFRFHNGNLFSRIRRTHANQGIFMPEAFDQYRKAVRFSQDNRHNVVRASDRTTIPASEHRCYCSAAHLWP